MKTTNVMINTAPPRVDGSHLLYIWCDNPEREAVGIYGIEGVFAVKSTKNKMEVRIDPRYDLDSVKARIVAEVR